MITEAVFRQLVPAIGPGPARAWAAAMEAARRPAGITTRRQASHWLGQMCHESAGFQTFEENLFYSAARLTAVWPARFATLEAAQPYARNPRALANRVYNGRMGNRTGSDDGWHFRGRGPKQLTGRDNYTAFEAWLRRTLADPADIRSQPELVTGPHYGALSAAWFWDARRLNAVLDRYPGDSEACAAVTRIINGGRIGLSDRMAWTRRALGCLGVAGADRDVA